MDNEPKSDANQELYSVADNLAQQYTNLPDLLGGIQRQIHSHSKEIPNPPYPKTIIESRFTPPSESYKQGVRSCGSIANISAAMLRHLGFQVKFIHGEIPESVDHAWISVLDEDTKEWVQYDLTRKDNQVTPDHKVKLECNDWEEIREQIEDDHKTMSERRRQRERQHLASEQTGDK